MAARNGNNTDLDVIADDPSTHAKRGNTPASTDNGNAEADNPAAKGHEGREEASAPWSGGENFLIRDGHGNETIENFDPAHDILTIDMAEISSYQDVLDRMSGDTPATIIFDTGDRLVLKNINPGDVTASNISFNLGPVCVMAGTLLRTERGEVAIEDLRPDDIIWTKQHGWQALKLVLRETVVFQDIDDRAKPVFIPKGALGANQPLSDLVMSPQNRVLQTVKATGKEVLVPAIKLVGFNGIRQMRGKKKVEYFNVVMERHSIIQAQGCWVESMLVTKRSLERHPEAAKRLKDRALGMTPARRVERIGVRSRRLKSA